MKTFPAIEARDYAPEDEITLALQVIGADVLKGSQLEAVLDNLEDSLTEFASVDTPEAKILIINSENLVREKYKFEMEIRNLEKG